MTHAMRDAPATSGLIEWAPFRLKPDVDQATLMAASEALQRDFLAKQPGFVRRELLRAADGQWVDLVYWESAAAAEQVMQAVAESPVCQEYFHLMIGADASDPAAGVQHYGIVGRYEKAAD